MRRLLRPSGLACIRSPDWAGWLFHPPSPLIKQAFRVFKQIQIANSGNPHVGRTLKALLRKAGFANISISASYEIVDDPAGFRRVARQLSGV
jgi:hypothetical protein